MSTKPKPAPSLDLQPVDPVEIQQAWRNELVFKRDAYSHQLNLLGRLVGIIDEQITEVDTRLIHLRKQA